LIGADRFGDDNCDWLQWRILLPANQPERGQVRPGRPAGGTGRNVPEMERRQHDRAVEFDPMRIFALVDRSHAAMTMVRP
jgi:hypothetical protein